MMLVNAVCFFALFPPVVGLSAVKWSAQSPREIPVEAATNLIEVARVSPEEAANSSWKLPHTALGTRGSPDEPADSEHHEAADSEHPPLPEQEQRAAEASHKQYEAWEEHEEVTPVSNAIACVVLGILFFNMSLFYLVNHPDADMRRTTWSCLSSTISIFCAVLIWGSLKEVMARCIHPLLHDVEAEHHDLLPHSKADVVIPFVEFCVTFALLQFILAKILHRPNWLTALSTIGAHVLGFSAIDAFGTFQHVQPFRDTWYYSCLCVPLCASMLLAAFHFFDVKRRRHLEDTETAGVGHWIVECCDAENESAGFILGLLTSQAVRFAICGKLEPNEGYPWGKTYPQVGALFVAVCIFGMLVMLSSRGLIFMENKRGHHDELPQPDLVIRSIQMTQATLSMSFGWCLLHCGRWLFWVVTDDHGVGDGDLMLARLIQALLFSYTLFAGIFVLDFFADQSDDDRAYRALIRGFGLVLGLSWESAFDHAIVDLSLSLEKPEQRSLLTNSLAIAVCVVVLPAWKMYILPKVKISDADDTGKEQQPDSLNVPAKECGEISPAATVLTPRGLMNKPA